MVVAGAGVRGPIPSHYIIIYLEKNFQAKISLVPKRSTCLNSQSRSNGSMTISDSSPDLMRHLAKEVKV